MISTTTILSGAVHATSEANADSILKSGFTKEATDNPWLGPGHYFFHGESATEEGQRWADKKLREGKLSAPLALTTSNIALGRCLDYDDPRCSNLIARTARALADRGKIRRGDIAPDSAVIAAIAQYHRIDTVRAVHTRLAFPGSHFVNFSITYVCVRNPKNISDVTILFRWTPSS